MNKDIKAVSFLTNEEKEMLKELSSEQQSYIKYMREDTAREYLLKEYKKLHPKTSKEFFEEFSEFSDKIDDNLLSKKMMIEERDFSCKYCGAKFSTEENRDKHQRICM